MGFAISAIRLVAGGLREEYDMRFGVLGVLEVADVAGTPVRLAGPARTRLLAALLCRPGQVVTADTLIVDLWGEVPPRSASKTLQSHVVRLRDDLGRGAEPLLVSHPGGYSLAVSADQLDALAFEQLVSDTSRVDAKSTVERLEQGLRLWRGDAFADFSDAPFAVGERLRLTELRGVAEERRIDLLLDLGHAAELVGELEAKVGRALYRERSWEQLMIALYRCGRQADALGAYARVRDLLASELGVDPGPGLRMLEVQVLRQDERLLHPRSRTSLAGLVVTSSDECPYQGLRSYRDHDAAMFVGREQLTAKLASLVGVEKGVIVTGPSGSGKSSLVQAGLVPALRGGGLPDSAGWRIAVGTPIGLRDLPERLDLLVLDQGEELFTALDADERSTACTALFDRMADGCRLMLVLRGDFYSRLGELGELSVLASRTFLVRPMRDDEIRRVIVEPALRRGHTVEGALVETVLDEMSGQVAAMPMLSVALARTWDNRVDGVLSLAGYRAGGGIAGALEASAEETYAALPADLQVAARRLLLRLSSRQADGWARCALPVASLESDESAALEVLTERRLTTISSERVEIVHDSLLDRWPRLRGWLVDRAQGADLLERLAGAAQAWHRDGRSPTDLYRGARLQAVLEWVSDRPEDVAPLERSFIDASVDEAEADLRAAQARADREATGRRRLRSAVLALAVLLAIVLGIGVVALRARNDAQQQAEHSAAAALTADAGRLAAESAAAPDLRTSLLLAVAGYRLEDSAVTRSALLSALEKSGSARYRVSTENRVQWLGANADGTMLWASDNLRDILRFDPLHRTVTAAFQYDGDHVDGVSPDGSLMLVSVSQNPPGRLHVIATGTGAVVSTLDNRAFGQVGGFTGDGLHLVVAAPHGDAVDVFDAQNLALPPTVVHLPSPATALAPAQTDFVAATRDAALCVVGTTTRTRPACRPLDPQVAAAVRGPPSHLTVNPQGTRAAMTSADTTRVWLMPTGDPGHHSVLARIPDDSWNRLAFSPDGTSLAIGGGSGSVLVLDARNGSPTSSLTGDNGDVLGLAWAPSASASTPDGGSLFSAGLDSQIVSWDLGSQARMLTLSGSAGPTMMGSLYGESITGFEPRDEPDGTSGPGPDSRLEVVTMPDLRRRTWPLRIPSGDGINTMATDASGRDALVCLFGRTGRSCRYLDLRSGASIAQRRFSIDTSGVDMGALDAGGRLAALSTGPGLVTLYRMPAFTKVRTISVHLTVPNAARLLIIPIAISPSGQLLVTGADYGTRDGGPPTNQVIALVDPATGHVRGSRSLGPLGAPLSVAYSPDGSRVAVGTVSGDLWLLSATTLRPVAPQVSAAAGYVLTTSFSPDGSMVVTGGTDGTLSFFDASTLRRIGNPVSMPFRDWVLAGYAGHSSTVEGLAPVTGSTQRAFRFPGDPKVWANTACVVAQSELTPAEWTRYVGDRPYRAQCPPHG